MEKRINFKLIVGLGNPGYIYDKTYHNVGKMFIDYLKYKLDGKDNELKKFKMFSIYEIGKIKLIKLNTSMNNSGEALALVLKATKSTPDKLVVVHDDKDIQLGRWKLSFGRGSAGHKGVEDIILKLKTKDFYRLRIGIGYKDKKAGEYVLLKIKKIHLKKIYSVFEEIIEKYILKLSLP